MLQTSLLHAVVGRIPEDYVASVRVATAAALPANTAAGAGFGATLTANGNGALTIDGVAMTIDDRVLVKDEAVAADRGIYVVRQPGNAGTPWILVRAQDFDEEADVTAGSQIPVEEGTANADLVWQLTTNNPIVIDTTALTFSLGSGAAIVTGWTDDGAIVRLTTATDTVAVGAATMNGAEKFRIVGDLRVEGVGVFTTSVVAPSVGPAAGQQHTLPAVASDTVALVGAAQTLLLKTLTTPTIADFSLATHTHQAAASGGTLDHGLALTGLLDDDHTQYVANAIARSITAQHSFAPGVAQAPFLLGANAQGQLVVGLNADQLDGLDQAIFARAATVFTAAAGLTGGGDLSAGRTFAVGAGTGITVNADDVAVNQATAFLWDADHEHLKSGTAVSAATQARSRRDRYTASMWTGAAEALRNFDVFAGVVTGADESGTGRARWSIEYNSQPFVEIVPVTAAPVAATGLIWRSQLAAGAVAGWEWRRSVALGVADVHTSWTDADIGTVQAQLLGDGSLQVGGASGGVVANPGLAYVVDPDTGLRRSGTGTQRIVGDGNDVAEFSWNGFNRLLYTDYLVITQIQGGSIAGHGTDSPLAIQGGSSDASIGLTFSRDGSMNLNTGATQIATRWVETFAPVGGASPFISQDHAITINQTGGATGTVVGHRIAITETAVAAGTHYFYRALGGAGGAIARFGVTLADGSIETAGSYTFDDDTDTRFYRVGADIWALNAGASEIMRGALVAGPIAQLSFFGVPSVARAAAYVQTFSTADRTHAAFTSADLATTAATQTSPWGFASQAQAENIATQVNLLRGDVDDLKRLANSIIDDLQAYGLFQ